MHNWSVYIFLVSLLVTFAFIDQFFDLETQKVIRKEKEKRKEANLKGKKNERPN